MESTQPDIHENTTQSPIMTPDNPPDPVIVIQPSEPEHDSTLSTGSQKIPVPITLTSPSQSSFVLSELSIETDVPPELANAEVSVAADRTFAETPSGPAARELKKQWDQLLGVGLDVRSPYAITAFVNQHGKQMFRIGRRELSAPAANAAEIEERITKASMTPSEPSTSPRTKRRSRISVHAHLPSIFKNGTSPKPNTPQVSASVPPRKLRKTRSIPDMISTTNDPGSAQASSSTGRIHSRSVTGADVSPFSTVVRNPNTIDLFGQLMDWQPPPSASASISTNSLDSSNEQPPNETHDHFKSPSIIAYPFGLGVTYDSPSRRNNAADIIPTQFPRHVREMQSFESGLTARQVDPPSKKQGRESSLAMEVYLDDDSTSSRPPSAMRVIAPTSPLDSIDITPTSATPEPTPPTALELAEESKPSPASVPESVPQLGPELVPEPAPEPILLSRYSPEVFDVLQNYRGLPMLDKLWSELESNPVIKLSLSSEESAAPRDDPRFVMWGEVPVDRDFDDQTLEHDSITDFSSVQSSSLSSRRRASKAKSIEAPSSLASPTGTQRVLIAATIERWIAQLTSDLNYDELLDFFLTYRTYVSSVDLLHLLIARFHWALQHSTSTKDERVRRIVRVRSFVAIRYWLLTFFPVDFIPNRELRLLMANWLNSLVHDPILRKHVDGLGIVRKLLKVAKECKQAHIRVPEPPKQRKSISKVLENHVLGAKFAAATRKVSEEEDSDVDLDFELDQGAPSLDAPQGFVQDIANAHLNVNVHGSSMSSSRPASIPFSSLSILQRTDHAPGPGTSTDLSLSQQAPAVLPTHRSAVSRVIVKTIGRLGRWRRTLNPRHPPNPPVKNATAACADVSAFEVDMNATVGEFESTPPAPSQLAPLPTIVAVGGHIMMIPDSSPSLPAKQKSVKELRTNIHRTEQQPLPTKVSPPVIVEPVVTPPVPAETPVESDPLSILPAPLVISLVDEPNPSSAADQISLRSSTSTDSFGEPVTSRTFPALSRTPWQFDVISIDDLSDTSSDHHMLEGGPSVPPGLRRPPKKLPMRRDFEFVRRDTVSSMGLASRDSMTSGTNTPSQASTSSVQGLGGGVAQWQLNALVDSLSDEEEKGDVEDALRRLEGQINPQKQLEKASKVDGWVRSIQERLAAGDYSDEHPPFFDDSDEEIDGDVDRRVEGSDNLDSDSASVRDSASVAEVLYPAVQDDIIDMVSTPIPTQSAHNFASTSPPGLSLPEHLSTDPKTPIEPAVPLEIIQGRLPSRPSSLSKTGLPQLPSRGTYKSRSFILTYRAADLAEHFAMIDRELFMGVKFEELVLDDWMNCKEVDVLDWAQYLKDRSRWKVERRYPDKTSALGAVRARFNLMANFTISEVVLASPPERPLVVGKLIRIAWKSYRMCNFSTLVAIITGLSSDWVARAMKKSGWGRVGMWENRMYRDLKGFATNADDFVHIRQAVTAIVDAKPIDVNSHAASVVSGGTDNHSGKGKANAERLVLATACIPFIGVYLSQLQNLSRLPDLIDPTAPEEMVGINPDTSNFDAPAHPEVFSALAPLPPSMHLEPLINVHKQRRIAGVIKALVAGQHLASRVQFDVDKKLFQRCLKVRAVNAETLQRTLLSD
ncbi:hypothetical protein H0H93_000358 [Arthromyces matolae]|nr:hypothetical protein H0H93_000358 [Arthromyces matolae]